MGGMGLLSGERSDDDSTLMPTRQEQGSLRSGKSGGAASMESQSRPKISLKRLFQKKSVTKTSKPVSSIVTSVPTKITTSVPIMSTLKPALSETVNPKMNVSNPPPAKVPMVETKQPIQRKNEMDENDVPETPPAPQLKQTTPVVPLKQVKPLSPPKVEPSVDNIKIRDALARPFGRNSLPQTLGMNWVVEVSPAEWDADEHRWKYRILVQRRILGDDDDDEEESLNSFTTAFTWRSLADFVWLEQALRAEYHGGLLLPLLSIAIGTPWNFTQDEVDATLLQDWLGDILNGIRGQGELVLNQDKVDTMGSEAMESFLYRNTIPSTNIRRGSMSPSTSTLDFAPWINTPETHETPEISFVESLWAKPLSCLPLDSLCDTGGASSTEHSSRRPVTMHLPLDMMNCSSRALGDAVSLDVQDSFALVEPEVSSSPLVIHSELLEAERELVMSYRQVSIAAMDKLRILTEEETQIGVLWKRFAISLSNLYTYEKDIEHVRLGESKTKERRQLYRKLSTKNMEDLLRVMTRQKSERSTPPLRHLDAMLGAYIGDLSAVGPAIKAYSDAIVQLTQLEDAQAQTINNNKPKVEKEQGPSPSAWRNQLRELASSTYVEIKKQITGNSLTTEATETTEDDNYLIQKKAFEERVLANEQLLRKAMTALCRATPVRAARMAWNYFTMEAAQVSHLSLAAHSMRTKVNIIDREALALMLARHKTESEEDDTKEMELVQRIVAISHRKKFATKPLDANGVEQQDAQIELDDDKQAEEAETPFLREKALQLARTRLGRWDASLALAIMEAVGIEDAEVRVEETTRDLRIVRKFAIGLRENLGRCVEAVNALQSIVLHGDSDMGTMKQSTTKQEPLHHLYNTRIDFIEEISDVFSGALVQRNQPISTPKSASTSLGVLAGAEIVTNDPAGWTISPSKRKNKKPHGRCGDAAVVYSRLKDAHTESLLTKLSSMLNDYQDRVEQIESFVYMQCVGIQLEKHCSQQRAEALAAFEKKTDITTAINIATRKRLPLLVTELTAKLDKVANVSHTYVKELKEMHLESKTFKNELSEIATRRFLRARETSTERVIEIMTAWAKYEEQTATVEIKALEDVIAQVEASCLFVDMKADGISHSFVAQRVLHEF